MARRRLPLTPLQQLALARSLLQRAADRALVVARQLEQQDRSRFAQLAWDIHDWALRATYQLTRLIDRLREQQH